MSRFMVTINDTVLTTRAEFDTSRQAAEWGVKVWGESVPLESLVVTPAERYVIREQPTMRNKYAIFDNEAGKTGGLVGLFPDRDHATAVVNSLNDGTVTL